MQSPITPKLCELILIMPKPTTTGDLRAREETSRVQSPISIERVQINPNYGTAYFNRGLIRKILGDSQGAIADFDRASAN